MRGNEIRPEAATVPSGDAASRVRRLCAVIAAVSVMLVWASVAGIGLRMAESAALRRRRADQGDRFPAGCEDFPAFRDRLAAKLGQPSDDTLSKMSDQIGTDAPVSDKRRSPRTGGLQSQNRDGNIRIVLEYEFVGRWVVVDAVVKDRRWLKSASRDCTSPVIRCR